MKFSYEQQKDLMTLMGALCDGTLDAEGQAMLEMLLLENAEAREIYRRYLNLHVTLRQYHINRPPESERPTSTSPILGFLGDSIQHGLDFCMRSIPFTIIVGIAFPLLCLVLAVTLIYRGGGGTEITPHQTVATLSKTYECSWEATGRQPVRGDSFEADQHLDLLHGLAELRLANGTSVIVEGPAVLDLVSTDRIRLQRGKLTAKVPKLAIGFSIETPDAIIVDLGTEFGVMVDAAGGSETEVFSGQVEAKPSWNNRQVNGSTPPKFKARRLTVGQMARFDRKTKVVQVTKIDLKASNFIREMPTSKTVQFQEGIAGYHATKATFIRNCVRGRDAPDSYAPIQKSQPDNTRNNYGNETLLLTASKTDQDGSLPEHSEVLIAFDNIFGDQPNQIPPNATILSATLSIHVAAEKNAESIERHTLYDVLNGWKENEATWANFNNGGKANKQYRAKAIAEFIPDRVDQFHKLDVTQSVQRWSRGEPNHGWILINHGINRGHFDSDDAPIVENRPRLVVQYKLPD